MLIKEIGEHVNGFEKLCIVCFLLSGEMHDNNHIYVQQCKAAQSEMLRYEDWKEFKLLCRLPMDKTYCLYCWFPQKPYELLHHKAESYNRRIACNLSNVCSLVVWMVFRIDHWWKLVTARIPVLKTFKADKEYAHWLVSKSKETGFVNALHLFLEIMKIRRTM